VLAEKYELNAGLQGPKQVEGMAVTHQSMEKLNSKVVAALKDAGVNAIALQPSAGGILENKKLIKFPVDVVEEMLDKNLTPVGYGDVLVDKATGVNILSGDHLVPYLARELGASRVVIATDVDGIFDGDPKDGKAKLVRELTREKISEVNLGGSKATDVTGGMKRKVTELLELAESGITSQVVSGLIENNLKSALCGDESLGTRIM